MTRKSRRSRFAGQPGAEHGSGSGLGGDQGCQHPEQGRLARTVGPADPDDLPAVDGEGDLVEDEAPAQGHTKTLDIDDRSHAGSLP